MSSNPVMQIDALIDEFRLARPKFEKFVAKTCALVTELLERSHILVATIETRAKSEESFARKINLPEKQGKYKKCSDLTDLAGIRIILFLQEDVQKVMSILRENFAVDEDNSYDVEENYAPDRFGYRSTHLIVSYGDARLNLFEFQDFKDFKAEIQIRTVLQHAWAQIDWKLRYRNSIEIPKTILRPLYRISALLESADNEFSKVASAVVDLEKNIKAIWKRVIFLFLLMRIP